MTRRWDYTPIRCAGCTGEIEACAGRYGDWMHSATRRERCATGGFARPQTPQQVDAARKKAS